MSRFIQSGPDEPIYARYGNPDLAHCQIRGDRIDLDGAEDRIRHRQRRWRR